MSRKRGLEWNFELEETYDADDVSMIKRLVCVGVCFVDAMRGLVWRRTRVQTDSSRNQKEKQEQNRKHALKPVEKHTHKKLGKIVYESIGEK